MADKDEGQLLTEEREKAYRERIAELKGQGKPPAPKLRPTPMVGDLIEKPPPKPKVKDA